MGKHRGTVAGQLIVLGATSTKMVTPDEVFERIENMTPTEEGGYRSITSWVEFNGVDTNAASGTAVSYASQGISDTHGIHHAKLGREGEREVLLLHNQDQVWEFRGWEKKWYPLIGPSTVSEAQVTWEAPSGAEDRWPTQFVTTPTGVVIVPSQGRAYFYDGEICAPLGFTMRPAPPVGLGPESSHAKLLFAHSTADDVYAMNDKGYSHSRIWGPAQGHDDAFGYGRIGTIEPIDHIVTLDPGGAGTTSPSAEADIGTAGRLLEGELRAKMAWIDPFGNLSPLSGESNPVAWDRMNAIQPSEVGAGPTFTPTYDFCNGRNAKLQVGWGGLSKGPEHAIAKNIYRTRDLLNSQDPNFYFLPGDAAVTSDSFATLPSRNPTFYPDNIPSSWLTLVAPDIDPVPIFRLGAVWGGRFWAANFLGNPAALRPSFPGMMGTFPAGGVIIPDPQGAEITAVHASTIGLLVFTRSSTFIITPNNSGDWFRVRTLSTSVGCVAPSSVATMSDGFTIWLGRDGFYGMRDGEVTYLFSVHRDEVRSLNRARLGRSHGYFNPETGQYECWVATNDSIMPDARYKFDGASWHVDTYTGTFKLTDTCVMDNNESMVLGCGFFGSYAYVVALDRGDSVEEGKVKTGWISSVGGPEKTSVREIHLWLRETGVRSLTGDVTGLEIKVRRNYRAEVQETKYINMYPDIDASPAPAMAWSHRGLDTEANPDVFGTALPTSNYYMRKRRPFWQRAVIRVPVCECFQLEISGTKMWEIIGMRADFEPRDESGLANTRG